MSVLVSPCRCDAFDVVSPISYVLKFAINDTDAMEYSILDRLETVYMLMQTVV